MDVLKTVSLQIGDFSAKAVGAGVRRSREVNRGTFLVMTNAKCVQLFDMFARLKSKLKC
jgi:hypothetical protein